MASFGLFWVGFVLFDLISGVYCQKMSGRYRQFHENLDDKWPVLVDFESILCYLTWFRAFIVRKCRVGTGNFMKILMINGLFWLGWLILGARCLKIAGENSVSSRRIRGPASWLEEAWNRAGREFRVGEKKGRSPMSKVTWSDRRWRMIEGGHITGGRHV